MLVFYHSLCFLSFIHYYQVSPCNILEDCVNISITPDPIYGRIMCQNNTCVCNVTNGCFEISNNTQSCVPLTCSHNSMYNDTCINNSHSVVTALVLTIFVGYTGAANYYEGNILFATLQATIFFLCIFLSYMICCLQWTTCCGGDNDGKKCILIIIFIIIAFFILILSIIMCLWWTAEIFLLALGIKKDGDGCLIVLNI